MLLAVDPGGTCGWSLWRGNELTEWGQLQPLEFLKKADEWMLVRRVGLVVCEEYRLRSGQAMAMSGSTMGTSQVIGALRWIAWCAGVEVVFQTPADKEFMTNDRLKALEVYQVGKPHANDSIRHALVYQYLTEETRDRRDLL